MSSQHPDARGGWKPKPLSALRRPSSLLKSANPSAPPNRTTPHPNDEPLHQIPITYSTIAARALSFHRQVLTDVTLSPTCPEWLVLQALKDNPIEEMQQLHLANCIWQIICRDLKPTFERPNMVTPSDTASPSQRPPPESAPASILPDEPSTMNIDTAPEQSTTIPEPGPQQPQPTCSSEVSQPPQPLYSTPPVTSTPDQQPTYASVLQRPKLCLPQPTSNTYQSVPSPKRTLTIEDLYRRFHNKPSPFQLNKKTSKSSASRARNKKASASQSLARFLISALPVFSRLLAEMQPAADDCWRPYRGTHYSRAMKAA
ncbi:hypothetical protein N7530_008873 [Penicillium desertorum]|uniref:Uncharacterized protein n=1 Tax=Penicillium desertorum TaxID=1303715 RepID=A0A9X0BLA0_9EURO|nr:hypothetical protein N7530_008873 [Penicillium desertorum]